MTRAPVNGRAGGGESLRQSERALLGVLLRTPACVAEARGVVSPADFYEDAHQLIYRALLDLADAGGGPVEVVSVCDELRRRGRLEDCGGCAYLASLAEAFGSPAGLAGYAGAVREAAARRRLRAGLARAAALADDDRAPLEEVLAGLRSAAEGPPPAREAGMSEPIPASQLKANEDGLSWLVHGILRRGEATLLSALWKSGKTTLLAHLLRTFEKGGNFIGRQTQAARVLYVSEESEGRWAARRDAVGIHDHCEFLIRPFKTKADHGGWQRLIDHLAGLVGRRGYDLVVLDTLANLWPVRDENDASAVQAALMPLHAVCGSHAALCLVHHLRKSDGAEATASRGSGALTGWVDTIIEFRRYLPADRKDRRRVLSGHGRDDATPDELVVELTECGYRALGDRDEVRGRDLSGVLAGLLPPRPPGVSADQLLDPWPEGCGTRPGRTALMAALHDGAGKGTWVQTGEGRRGSPYLFFRPPPPEQRPD
jgi:hypothetical protein